MNQKKLGNAKNLLFIALGIDMVVNALGAISDIWMIGVFNDIRFGVSTANQSTISSLEFGEMMTNIMLLTLVGVGLALLHWLGACYVYAKETLKANGFAHEGWKTWGWILPFINVFKPYQVLSEIYKVGSTDYIGGDAWKRTSGSRSLLIWWYFWVVTHMIMLGIGKQQVLMGLNSEAPTLVQIIGMYYMSITVCVISFIVSALWFVVAGNLTKRLLNSSTRATVLEAPIVSPPSYVEMAPSVAKLSSEALKITKITIVERIRPKRSLLIAALFGTTFFLLLFANGYLDAQRFVAENSLENQVFKYYDRHLTQNKGNHNHTEDKIASDTPPNLLLNKRNGFYLTDEDITGLSSRCTERVVQVINNFKNAKGSTTIPSDVLRQLLADKECSFYEPKIADYLSLGKYTLDALVATALAFALCLLAFWVLTYSHLGWRRIAVIFGPLCGVGFIVLMIDSYETKPFAPFIIAIAVAIASSGAIVIGRETYLWVWRGFGKNRSAEKGSSLFCKKCGTEAVADAKFCNSCGGVLNQAD
ncbi:DUF4328 domain-containing protein [Sulfurirhabdus autotrophica]|uniref:Uncharacterized protein DUF4328 n=1 Tax=Sulfurirhabdus autotrophica TaxID=1706046 RepID=A0A4R3XRD6_9PROT|nr:DUF4328 domain-containing protein [Sulfurirhabdus autotrophica]TCV80090.1 uncharacterized protein DUF4328 [Sulfurirhabdus autotrophica]